ncbi:MAG TPA: CNNM domain-containing protein [Phycisphaerae bacterium]|nr:CNNM domain-containing protein [Phycisphaerae bacterium]
MIAQIATSQALIWIGLCVTFVFFSAIFSGAETGMYCINMTRLRLAAHQENPAAMRVQDILRDRAAFLFTSILGTNICHYLAPVCLTLLFIRALGDRSLHEAERLAELYTMLILTPVFFIFGDAVPKNVFHRNANAVLMRFSLILKWGHRLFECLGIIWLQRKVTEIVSRSLSPRAGSGAFQARLDVYQMLREGAAEGALTLTQASILERIDRLRSLRVASVMVPLPQMVTIAADTTRAAAETVLRIARVSRLPVYQGDRRRIVGVVHVLDLLTSGEGRAASEVMRPPVEIMPGTRVVDALAVLQREARRMAIVVGPDGRCLGLVTVKDLVEEIVGELKAW